jgi:hypothetical protein
MKSPMAVDGHKIEIPRDNFKEKSPQPVRVSPQKENKSSPTWISKENQLEERKE